MESYNKVHHNSDSERQLGRLRDMGPFFQFCSTHSDAVLGHSKSVSLVRILEAQH